MRREIIVAQDRQEQAAKARRQQIEALQVSIEHLEASFDCYIRQPDATQPRRPLACDAETLNNLRQQLVAERLVPVRHSGSLSTQGGERSEQARPEDFDTRQLYKDCIRLSHHIAARSPKGEAMRSMIRQQFKSNMGETDPTKINELKMRAISGIQNYVIHENTRKALSKKGKEYASSFDAGSGGGSSGSSGSSSGAS